LIDEAPQCGAFLWNPEGIASLCFNTVFMKHYWSLFFTALTLLFTSCIPQETTPRHSTAKKMYISATGLVDISPNMASFNVTVTALNKDIKKAREQLAKGTQTLHHLLETHGIEAKQVVSDRISLRKHSEYQYNKYVFVGYRAQVSNHIIVKDLTQLEALYSACLVQEDFSISGLNYGHSAADSLQRQAYSNALDKAHSLADNLLNKLPENKRTVIRISNDKLPSTSEPYLEAEANARYNATSDALAKGPKVHFGEVQYSETLYIEYAIE